MQERKRWRHAEPPSTTERTLVVRAAAVDRGWGRPKKLRGRITTCRPSQGETLASCGTEVGAHADVCEHPPARNTHNNHDNGRRRRPGRNHAVPSRSPALRGRGRLRRVDDVVRPGRSRARGAHARGRLGMEDRAPPDELGPGADKVFFADMASVGHNPRGSSRPGESSPPGLHARRSGSGGSASRCIRASTRTSWSSAIRHESLLNLAFADAGPFWLVCPYDVSAFLPS